MKWNREKNSHTHAHRTFSRWNLGNHNESPTRNDVDNVVSLCLLLQKSSCITPTKRFYGICARVQFARWLSLTIRLKHTHTHARETFMSRFPCSYLTRFHFINSFVVLSFYLSCALCSNFIPILWPFSSVFILFACLLDVKRFYAFRVHFMAFLFSYTMRHSPYPNTYSNIHSCSLCAFCFYCVSWAGCHILSRLAWVCWTFNGYIIFTAQFTNSGWVD